MLFLRGVVSANDVAVDTTATVFWTLPFPFPLKKWHKLVIFVPYFVQNTVSLFRLKIAV